MNSKGLNIQTRVKPRNRLQEVAAAVSCPMCGGEDIRTTMTSHEFDYGSGDSSVKLLARVPARQCESCSFEFLDDEAERLKHMAVCNHLGVLAPDQIRKIRENRGMTRAAFADATGLGEASLNRWENGLSIQTQAYDRYLRLLSHPEPMRRLLGFKRFRCSATHAARSLTSRFPTVKITESLLMDQAAFSLRKIA